MECSSSQKRLRFFLFYSRYIGHINNASAEVTTTSALQTEFFLTGLSISGHAPLNNMHRNIKMHLVGDMSAGKHTRSCMYLKVAEECPERLQVSYYYLAE